MSKIRQQFGKRIKQLRLEKSLTQENLAEASNLSVDFISLVERGINSPSFESLEALANALGVEVFELFLFSAE